MTTATVPRLCVGRARALRRQIEAHEPAAVARIATITAPLDRRYRTHVVARPESLITAERAWRDTVPQVGRIRLDTKLDLTAKTLRISELRVQATAFKATEWDGEGYEPGVTLNLISLLAEPKKYTVSTTCVALVGLHAMARHYQRAEQPGDAALLEDLIPLAEMMPTMMRGDDGADIEIGCANAGRWRGCVGTVTEQGQGGTRLLLIRTYVGRD